MQGYGADGATQALNSATTDGNGGTSMTLSDGTRIDLVGVTTVGHSLFS